MKKSTEFEVENTEPVKESKENIYFVTVNNLNIRRDPGRQYDVIGTATEGENEIVDITQDPETGIRWGRLATGGWIDLQYARKVN